jgi:hypothetical protein
MSSPLKRQLPQKPAPKMRPEAFTGELAKADEELTVTGINSLNKNVFIPTWDNSPEELLPIVTLDGGGILTYQNMTAIISSPGLGKSAIVEAIGASYLNPKSDCLGFEIDQACKGVIIIDNERTNYDVWSSFHRMCARAQIPTGGKVKNVTIAGLRLVPRLDERLNEIEKLLKIYPCSLLIIDGAGDLVSNINDPEQSTACRIWLREITVKYNLSIIVTLHPNPNSDKPRGHQGSEICREAECVLLIEKHDKDTRIITSDFEHGKNRNNANITTSMEWSVIENMFVSVDYEFIVAKKRTAKAKAERQQLEKLAKSIFTEPTPMQHSQLVIAIMKIETVSEITAKRKIKSMLNLAITKKNNAGHYLLNLDDGDE